MKKSIHMKKEKMPVISTEVYLDFTDPNKPIKDVIAEAKEEIKKALEAMDDTAKEILTEVLEAEEKKDKKLNWFKKLWRAIKSIF